MDPLLLRESSKPNSAQRFKDYVMEMSRAYKSKHLLMLVGANINFEKAELYYQQLTMLIN